MTHDYETYKLGDFELESGEVLQDAFIAYKTYGEPNLPAVIYPTWYSGSIADNIWLIGDSMTLSPQQFFIVIPALFGNGQSSSPSNTPIPRPFPRIAFRDNVRAQHQLVTQHLAISHAFAVLGWSMGAGQTYQWATQYPDFMDCAVPFCGSAKTSLHNQVFLEGVKSALLCAKGAASAGIGRTGEGCAESGEYRGWTKLEREVGLKGLGRVYAGWGFSQAFYRQRLFETAPTLGFKDLEDFMVNFWEAWALSKDPENMLAMLYTWQSGDCSKQEPYKGDFDAAMKGIKAKTLVLPGQTDLYFPQVSLGLYSDATADGSRPEDSQIEVDHMRPGVGKMEPIPSVWGHWAGGPGQSVDDVRWLDTRLNTFFKTVRESLGKEGVRV